ncbi:keratin-associated protein 13-2-like [Delphinapterus leucas]|uniref:Keratin-associated protein n=1 Tax=Delphinapterus leucas TaxID=9749 RepID=A0A2Y9N725_DELLE|nr:keratin-associated protein 13-2-like [Delphinapterus leucas]
MSYYHCSGNFSSRSLGDHLCYSGSSCGSSYPSNLVYSTDRCSPSSCRLDSSLQSGCYEPIRCLTSCVLSSPCQTFCYRPRTCMLYSPCWTTYPGSLGSRSSRGCSLGYGYRSCYTLGFGSHGRGCSLGYGSRSCYTLGFGSHGFRPLGYEVYAFP